MALDAGRRDPLIRQCAFRGHPVSAFRIRVQGGTRRPRRVQPTFTSSQRGEDVALHLDHGTSIRRRPFRRLRHGFSVDRSRRARDGSRLMLKAGIVGLPNVGKSTLFNALTRSRKAEAANYPFCTIDPNVGVVIVPDDRALRAAKNRQDQCRRSGGHRVRRHRRTRGGRQQGRRSGQPVPGQHPRSRRHRAGRALLRGSGHRSHHGWHRSGARHRGHHHRARPRRPGCRRQTHRQDAEESEIRRQGSHHRDGAAAEDSSRISTPAKPPTRFPRPTTRRR